MIPGRLLPGCFLTETKNEKDFSGPAGYYSAACLEWSLYLWNAGYLPGCAERGYRSAYE
jgi:hypothetical protein